jgi:outer membrane protein TolC
MTALHVDAVRNVDTNFALAQISYNRRVAAERQVEAVQAAYDANTVTFDQLLDAQRRRAQAESSYYGALVDYNRAISQEFEALGGGSRAVQLPPMDPATRQDELQDQESVPAGSPPDLLPASALSAAGR